MEEEGSYLSTGGADLGLLSGEAGGLVTARGNRDGLIMRLDGQVDEETIKAAAVDFLEARRDFFKGNDVILEWVGREPDAPFIAELSEVFLEDFKVRVKSSGLRKERRRTRSGSDEPRPRRSTKLAERASRLSTVDRLNDEVEKEYIEDATRPLSLFDGVDAISINEDEPEIGGGAGKSNYNIMQDSFLWDEPDARVVFSTLRSGQKIESDYSVVVCGDVNSGAEIVAGGDIFVLGTLRGVAHAGAYDETGGGRLIFALDLKPMQLRIGGVISRGAADGGKGAEIARVDGNLISVEPYRARTSVKRRRTRANASV